MKLVVNEGQSPFCLNELAYEFLGLDWQSLVIAPLERAIPGGSKEITPLGFAYEKDRANKKLVEMVEKLGTSVGGPDTHLVVVEIPDFSIWHLENDENGYEILVWK